MADTFSTFDGGPGKDSLYGTNNADTIYGNGGADTLIGNAGNDFIYSGNAQDPHGLNDNAGDLLNGGSDNDTVMGGNGNDTLIGGGGSNLLDGGNGLDIALYTGAPRGDFTIASKNGEIGITSATGGVDTLVNVERVLFSDVGVAYDIEGLAGQVYRLYQAALNRAPEASGLGYYFNVADEGTSIQAIAYGFTHSPEFARLYGANVSDQVYIANLYRNALHREAEPEGMQYWTDKLQNGMTREQVLLGFSESPENKAAVIGSIQHGITYDPVA